MLEIELGILSSSFGQFELGILSWSLIESVGSDFGLESEFECVFLC